MRCDQIKPAHATLLMSTHEELEDAIDDIIKDKPVNNWSHDHSPYKHTVCSDVWQHGRCDSESAQVGPNGSDSVFYI